MSIVGDIRRLINIIPYDCGARDRHEHRARERQAWRQKREP